jgi:drug/metabolite transporter (DMT)-like permease
MKRRLLLGYQIFIGLSDASTGVLLIVAPETTLHMMRLHASQDVLPYLSYVGVFVLSVGIACLYGGGLLAVRPVLVQKLEAVWLLTAITRGLVAIFVVAKIFSGLLEPGWITVALTDGAIALLQAIGLTRGWLSNVTP